jgi:hypothetical protein
MSTKNIDSVSASTISATATTGGCHLLKITGYSQSKLLDNGVAVQSCEFEAGGYRWCILYYPRSRKSADNIYIEVKLTSKDVSCPVNTKIQFTLILHHGEPTPPPAPAPATTYSMYSRKSFDYTGYHWGFPFITREEFESSGYLVDDCSLVENRAFVQSSKRL